MTNLCRFDTLSHTVNYQHSRLNTILFHYFNENKKIKQQKNIKYQGSNDHRADQKTEQNDGSTLRIPRANLELKHMFVLCP